MGVSDRKTQTFGLVIAGGRSRRMGRDKASLLLGGVSLLERACWRLAEHCPQIAVSLRGPGPADPIAAELGLTRLVDAADAPEGPLSGVLAGLRWAQAQRTARVATLPCDVPFPPADLIGRLLEAAGETGCAVARTPQATQSLCAVWNVAQLPMLEAALATGRHPPVHAMLEQAGAAFVDYDGGFENLNTPEDLAVAEARLG
jgi:molybdenum cofactor guanylyltransferase